MNNNIGLAIWGCNGGHRAFCSNNIQAYTERADIRQFVRFVQNRLDTYALEFSDTYKIYTLYRSCYDNGTGAYVAISIYMPHSQRMSNVREMLGNLMDKYFDDYIHPLTCSYLPGKYNDIKPFDAMLNDTARVSPEPKKEAYQRSPGNIPPHIRLYGDINEVDQFFLQPYRKEFFACQEVLFIPGENNTPAFMQFSGSPVFIEKVSDPEPLPKLIVDQCVRDIKELSVNGERQDVNGDIRVSDYDGLEIALSRPYHHDLTIVGTVEELRQKGYLTSSGRNISLRVTADRFIPKEYTVRFTLDGQPVPEKLVLVSFRPSFDFKFLTGSSLTLRGEDVKKPLYWAILPTPDAPQSIAARQHIRDIEVAVNKNLPVNLEADHFTFNVKTGNVKASRLLLRISSRETISFPIKKESVATISFTLPKGDFVAGRFDAQCDVDANCTINDTDIIIEQKPREYNLRIDNVNLDQCRWDFLVNGASRRKRYNAVYLTADEREDKTGRLTIDGVEFDYKITANSDIIPKGHLVYPENRLYPGMVIADGQPCEVRTWRIFRDKPVAGTGFTLTEQPTHGSDLKIHKVAPSTISNGYGTNTVSNTGDSSPYGHSGNVNDFGWSKDDGGNGGRHGNNDWPNSGGGGYQYGSTGDNYPSQPTSPTDKPLNRERKIRFGLLAFIAAAVLVVAGFFIYNKLSRPNDKAIAKCVITIESQSSEIPELKLPTPSVTVKAKEIDGRPLVNMIDSDTVAILYQPKYFNGSDSAMDNYAKEVLTTVVCLEWPDGYTEEYSLRELDEGGVKRAVIGYKPENGNTEKLTLKVKPKAITDAESFINRYWKNDTASVFYAEAKNLAENHPVLKDFLIEKCWEKLDTTSIANLTAYLNTFPENHLLYDANKNTKVKEWRTQLTEAADVITNATTHGNALWKTNCTNATVKAARSWYNSLTPQQKPQAKYNGRDMGKMITAYELLFFNAKEAGDLKSDKEQYFSEYQKKAYHYYGENPTNFRTCTKNRDTSLFTVPYKLDPNL